MDQEGARGQRGGNQERAGQVKINIGTQRAGIVRAEIDRRSATVAIPSSVIRGPSSAVARLGTDGRRGATTGALVARPFEPSIFRRPDRVYGHRQGRALRNDYRRHMCARATRLGAMDRPVAPRLLLIDAPAREPDPRENGTPYRIARRTDRTRSL